MAHRGQAFWGHHMFVVLSNPALDPDRVVLLNITSCKTREDFDRPDVIWPAEHPEVKQASYGAFARAKVTSAALVDLAASRAHPASDFSADLLVRLCRYAATAREVSGEVLGVLRAQGLP